MTFIIILASKIIVWLSIVATSLYLAYGIYNDFHRNLPKQRFYQRLTFEVTFLEGLFVLAIGISFSLATIAVTGVASVQFLSGIHDQILLGAQKPLHWYNWI